RSASTDAPLELWWQLRSSSHQPEAPTSTDDPPNPPNVALENALPSFAAAAETPRSRYAVMLSVAIVCGALLGGMVAMRRHAARSVALAPHTPTSERAAPPAKPPENTNTERAEPLAQPRE